MILPKITLFFVVFYLRLNTIQCQVKQPYNNPDAVEGDITEIRHTRDIRGRDSDLILGSLITTIPCPLFYFNLLLVWKFYPVYPPPPPVYPPPYYYPPPPYAPSPPPPPPAPRDSSWE